MTKSQMVFKKAVRLAKTFVGDWIARMSLALRIVWAAVKKGARKMVELAELKGSPKQIKWAEVIRKVYFESAEKKIETIVRKYQSSDKYFDNAIKALNHMKDEESAAKWINNFKKLTSKEYSFLSPVRIGLNGLEDFARGELELQPSAGVFKRAHRAYMKELRNK